MIKIQNNYLLNKRLELLKFAKIIVAEQGFNSETIKVICNTFNLDKNETGILFPDGSNDLIKFALEQLNKELQEYCKKFDLLRLPIHKMIL